MDESIFKAVTLGIALLGAALGVVNLWRAWSNDRVKMRVAPAWAFFSNGADPGLVITVVNLSTFPITITDVGLSLTGKRRAPFPDPGIGSDKLPKCLEPRTSLTVFAPPGTHQNPQFATVRTVYARTACGLNFTGTSGALRGMVKEARAAASK